MNAGVFITVRTGSTRLPLKVLKKIDHRSSLQILLERTKMISEEKEVVVCTTTHKEDDQIAKVVKENNIKLYRGSSEDLVSRWYCAAKENNIDFFINIDGDDLLYSEEMINEAIKTMKNSDADFLCLEDESSVICGCFTFGIRTSFLERIVNSKKTEDTQYMWLTFKNYHGAKISHLKNIPEYILRPEIRATLDYQEDLDFFKQLFKLFSEEKIEENLKSAVTLINKNSNIAKINRSKHIDYLKNQKLGVNNQNE